MSPLRIVTLVVLASVIGAGVAYALVGLIQPDEPAAVAPVVIDPAAGTQRTATTTTPRTTGTQHTTATTRTSTTTTRTEPEADDDGWEAGPPIESDDDSGHGRGRGRGRGGERNDELGTATPEIERSGSSGGDDGSGGSDDSSGKGSGGGGDDD